MFRSFKLLLIGCSDNGSSCGCSCGDCEDGGEAALSAGREGLPLVSGE